MTTPLPKFPTHFRCSIVRRNQQNLLTAKTKRVATVNDRVVGRWWKDDKNFTHYFLVKSFSSSKTSFSRNFSCDSL